MKSLNGLVAHGGGPTSVLNSSLLGVIQGAREGRFHSLWSPRGGLAGILSGEVLDLLAVPKSSLRKASSQCGSAIGSFRGRLSDRDLCAIIEFCRQLDIHYFFYTGGNGSMGTLQRLAELALERSYEIIARGIPKTVDNDICETDHCPGFGSAARFAAMAVREIGLDQRALPTPVSIVEVMGRNTGWLAAATILARLRPDDPPHFVYAPETPFDCDEFLGRVDRLLRRQVWVVGVVAEGLKDEQGRMIAGSRGHSRDAKGRPLAGDVAAHLARLVSRKLRVRARSEKPGLLCRAFGPCQSPVDAAEACAIGRFAVRSAITGDYPQKMAAFERLDSARYSCRHTLVDLDKVAGRERTLPLKYLRGSADVQDAYRKYAAPLIGPALDPPLLL